MDDLSRLWPDDDRRDNALARIRLTMVRGRPNLNSHPRDWDRLRDVERRTLEALSHGLSKREAGDVLGCSYWTVCDRLDNARWVLGAKTTVQAVAEALRLGLIA